MAKYLQEDNLRFLLREKQNTFQCRTNDIYVKANRSLKYNNWICRSCNETDKTETQEHLLQCKNVFDRNARVIYIPVYSDLYSNDTEEQMYTIMILCENLSLVPM